MRLMASCLTAVVLAGMSLGAAQPGKQKKHHEGKQASVVHTTAPAGGTNVAVSVVFGSRDVVVVREYYAPRYRSLPPGLQKKVARGGSLPPGWQKKMEPFPPDLDRRLSPLPAGYSRGVIDAHAVIYNSKGMVIDVAVLF